MTESAQTLAGVRLFLSASVPEELEGRFSGQDQFSVFTALVDGVLCLGGTLVFGGHPSLLNLLHGILQTAPNRVEVFLSEEYRNRKLPAVVEDRRVFPTVAWVPKEDSESASLTRMRREIVRCATAGVFVGGKRKSYLGNTPGIREEYELFVAAHPTGPAYLIGMLGGTARDLIRSGVIEPNGLGERERRVVHESVSVDLVVGIILADLQRTHGGSTSSAPQANALQPAATSLHPGQQGTAPMIQNYLTQTMTLLGTIGAMDPANADRPRFTLKLRSGDDVSVTVGKTTNFQPLTNLDEVNRDRYQRPPNYQGTPLECARLYLVEGTMVSVEGIYQRHGGKETFEARTVHLLQQAPLDWKPGTNHADEMGVGTADRRFYFEYTYWWITQIQRLADRWLDDLFGERRDYQLADFAELYRTNLNILGDPTDDNVQEMATLSRLIYGLSSAFLLTGSERYYMAAKAGIAYQREAFRGSSADARFRIWSSAKRRMRHGSQYTLTSQNSDDLNTVPLYEQIYALAGMAQYYRITNAVEVLDDIRYTVRMFQDFFHDRTELKGYFSHLDYVTVSARDPSLGPNQGARTGTQSATTSRPTSST